MLSFNKGHKRKSLSKDRGTACLGVILARACSSRIKTRYCLTLWWEAGLPMPNKSFHSPPRPNSTKSERSFPIRFATVPATRVDGHEQTSAFLAPNKEQVGTWTLVFPFCLSILRNEWRHEERLTIMFWGTVRKKGNSRALFEAWTFVPGTVCDR